jgi:SAM-dependent methyltransferase
MTGGPTRIFDRARVRRARARSGTDFPRADFLHCRILIDLVDRLETTTRAFDRAAFYGAAGLECLLTPKCGVGEVVFGDFAGERLPASGARAVFDEERSPLASGAFDLIVSVLTLHTANDLVGALIQHKNALKPDGLFIAALFGEATLSHLRRALYEAEAAQRGGAALRIAPFADIKSLGGAMQRAGFALPVADLDNVDVSYEDPLRLLEDLGFMGERGVLAERAGGLTKKTLAAALAAHPRRERFDIVYLTGWAPHPGQQKPLRPGSATTSMEQAVKGLASSGAR